VTRRQSGRYRRGEVAVLPSENLETPCGKIATKIWQGLIGGVIT